MTRRMEQVTAAVFLLVTAVTAGGCGARRGATPDALQENKIAREAYIYAFPMIANYKAMYQFTVDRSSPQYKGPFNRIANEARVFTPKDTTVITPNSDTPYSLLSMDLRAEPLVLCVPAVDKKRYYSVQLIDMYTFNYGYIGSRATGNGAGCYMVAGPSGRAIRPPVSPRSSPAKPILGSPSTAPNSSTPTTSRT